MPGVCVQCVSDGIYFTADDLGWAQASSPTWVAKTSPAVKPTIFEAPAQKGNQIPGGGI